MRTDSKLDQKIYICKFVDANLFIVKWMTLTFDI